MKVHIWPCLDEIEEANGIGRVVYAQYRHLPNLGITLTANPYEADVIAPHTRVGELPRVDVLHLHGIYWTADPGASYLRWHHRINQEIADSARKAQVVTVPSEWVAYPFQRDMRIKPAVIGHGVELSEYRDYKTVRGDYILWNKNRSSDVCSPKPADELFIRGYKVISTFTNLTHTEGYPITGVLPSEEMKRLLAECEIYLATTQETFGIGTVEALALGKPVLGYRWGGTEDLVRHKQDGYLVEPGDYAGLEAGVAYIRGNYARLSANARKRAEGYDWASVIRQYADLYATIEPREYRVSFVITNHNYEKYVGRAIDSVKAQTIPVELVVVDDASTDNSVEEIAKRNPGITIFKQENEGVAAARNDGIRASSGTHIVCLDADDFVDPVYAQALIGAFKKNHGLGVAYTGLTVVPETGHPYQSSWPPEFSWNTQSAGGVPPGNCIPAGAMFSKKMWERAGGYKQVYAPGEDAEFWVRGLACGFEAQKAVPDSLFYYQVHSSSASRTKTYRDIMIWHPWYNDRRYPLAAPHGVLNNPISSYPVEISVIIPVGADHDEHVGTAIESVLGQSFRNWEIIAISDTDISGLYPEYPFVRWLTRKGQPGRKRNLGQEMARGKYLVFLDADDFLHPAALSTMLEYHKKSEKYVYTDWVVAETGETQQSPEYTEEAAYRLMNPVTVLLPKAKTLKWDEKRRSLEDEDFFTRLYAAGLRGERIPYPLLYVRQSLSTRTRKDH